MGEGHWAGAEAKGTRWSGLTGAGEMGVPFPCGMGGPGLDRGPQLSPGQLCTGAGQDRIVGRCSDLFPRHFLCERGRMLKTTNCYDLPSQRLFLIHTCR